MNAFVLGAGLGTRLRPLTARRPKPLVPIYGKPLITFAFDHLAANGVDRLVVNTHHCPEAYAIHTPGGSYRGLPLTLRHEPVLLDTGGGIKNVEDLLTGDPFVVYNGDVLADFPLRPIISRHLASGRIATLVLRSSGGPLQVQCRDGLVCDIRRALGAPEAPAFLFTGITILSPEIFRLIPAGQPVSIIPVYLDMIRAGIPVGGDVVDEGLWFDLGSREAYLGAHSLLRPGGHRLSYALPGWPQGVPSSARCDPSATLCGASAIGEGAIIGAGASLQDCVVWENACVLPGARLSRCVVRDGCEAGGEASDRDW